MRNLFRKLLQKKVTVLARLTLRIFHPTIITITGSVGKTSSKEAIWASLKEFAKIRRTSANFNNELGVPLTILGDYQEITKPAWLFWSKVIAQSIVRIITRRNGYPKILVLEYGADKPGDIGHLLTIAKPHIAVISAIGQIPVHVEFYPQGIEQVAREKGKLISDLSVDNVAVLNYDDPSVVKLKEKTRAKVVGFGFSKDADVRITNFKHVIAEGKIDGITFKLEKSGASVPVMLKNVFSVSHAYAAACAVATASIFGKNVVESANAFALHYVPAKGRSNIIRGVKRTQIIDESYNSSPAALEMALKTMKEVSHARKIAVLGDMMELGEYAAQAHEAMGELAPSCVDILITVGPRARFIAQKALKKKMPSDSVFMFDVPEEAGQMLEHLMRPGDLVLIKGSRVVGLDKIIDEIKAV